MRCESHVQSLMLLLMCLVKHTGSGASLQSTDVICRVVQGPMGLPGDNITCLQLKRFERPQLQLACMVTTDFELLAPGGGLPPSRCRVKARSELAPLRCRFRPFYVFQVS